MENHYAEQISVSSWHRLSTAMPARPTRRAELYTVFLRVLMLRTWMTMRLMEERATAKAATIK